MTFRFSHIVVIIVVLVLLLATVTITNSLFIKHSAKETARDKRKFQELDSALKIRDYEYVTTMAMRMLQDNSRGRTEIQAKAYLGLAALRTGLVDEAKEHYRFLNTTYLE